jgi:hypothetical protein
MPWWLRQIGACFNYIRIRDGDNLYYSKRVFDFILPAVFAIGSVLVHFFVGAKPIAFGENGILSGFRDLLELLAPFFLASLAAVATFGSDKLSLPLRGNPAVMAVRTEYGGQVKDITLSRRQFMCYLFGYLCSISMFVLICTIIGDSIAKSSLIVCMWPAIAWIAVVISYFVLWHILFVTLLSIYFLSDRLHAE